MDPWAKLPEHLPLIYHVEGVRPFGISPPKVDRGADHHFGLGCIHLQTDPVADDNSEKVSKCGKKDTISNLLKLLTPPPGNNALLKIDPNSKGGCLGGGN